jgi:hypothetical protein
MKGQSRSSVYRRIKKAVDLQLLSCQPSTSSHQAIELPASAILSTQLEPMLLSETDSESVDLCELSHSEQDFEECSNENPSYNLDTSSAEPFQLLDFLRNWSLSNNITQSATSQLLRGLQNLHPELPIDARTLLKTPRHVAIDKMGCGDYAYFGIIPTLIKNVAFFNPALPHLALNFNVDGIPLFKDSRLEFWPILCSVQDYDLIPPFPVAVFCGVGKPPIDDFFKDFILEVNTLQETGLNHEGVCYSVTVRAFVADAPAKAYMRCVKLYSGYHGCDRCLTEGTYAEHRMTFPELNAPLRTDESFAARSDEPFHHRASPLLDLNIGLISTFPLDYMHLVCLGVTKRLVQFWIRGMKGIKGFKRARLSVAYQNAVSAYLMNTKSVWPSDFSRDPRGLIDIDRWKATELRQFLLYVSLPALKDVLEADVYEHFLLLHCAISILSGNLYLELNRLAHRLLKKFVKDAPKFYGVAFVVYNVHALVHLSSDSLRLGKLDSFGAFKFENKLGMMKAEIRSHSMPLQQLCKRVAEKENCNFVKAKKHSVQSMLDIHETGPTAGCSGTQFKKLVGPDFDLATNSRDRTVFLLDQRVMVIKNFICSGEDGIFVIGYVYKKYSDFYSVPIKSSKLSVYFAENLSDVLTVVHLSSVRSKAASLPYKNGVVVSPLLHNPVPSK